MSLSQILLQDILHYCYSSLFIALYLPVSFPLIPAQRFPISFSNFRTNLRSESRLYASIFIVSLFINIYQIYNVNKFITKFYIWFLIIRINTILSSILTYRKTFILPRIYHEWISLDMTYKITLKRHHYT